MEWFRIARVLDLILDDRKVDCGTFQSANTGETAHCLASRRVGSESLIERLDDSLVVSANHRAQTRSMDRVRGPPSSQNISRNARWAKILLSTFVDSAPVSLPAASLVDMGSDSKLRISF